MHYPLLRRSGISRRISAFGPDAGGRAAAPSLARRARRRSRRRNGASGGASGVLPPALCHANSAKSPSRSQRRPAYCGAEGFGFGLTVRVGGSTDLLLG